MNARTAGFPRRTYGLLPLLASLCLAGCFGGSGEPGDDIGLHATDLLSDSGRVIAEVAADRAIRVGTNSFVVKLAPAEGQSFDSIEIVAANALMPAHGHESQPGVVEPDGDAHRIGDLRLSMSGQWEITLDLREDGAADTLRFGVEVP